MRSHFALLQRDILACLTLAAGCAWSGVVFAQTTKPAISLDSPTGWELQVHTLGNDGKALRPAPPNFRRFGEARAGVLSDLHTLTLRFGETATLTSLVSTADFKIEGGSCIEGNVYGRDTTCTVLMRFTPQGPGNRLGHLKVSTSNSVVPMDFGLGGIGYFPAISFIPAAISTVPGTYVNSAGLLKAAVSLSVDGGDTLYIADTGNNVVRMLDSTGKIQTIIKATGPWGVAADSFGDVYWSEPTQNVIGKLYASGHYETITGTGAHTCNIHTSPPCSLSAEMVINPGQITIDKNDVMFFPEQYSSSTIPSGATMVPTHPYEDFIRLDDYFPYYTLDPTPLAMAVDMDDNLYSPYTLWGNCQIVLQSLASAAYSQKEYSKVAGGRSCGFSGDGGLAGNAKLSPTIGQIAFDVYGNLYFTDSGNQRVRRIDRLTGIIRTIAGNGAAGYGGDTGPATLATLSFPFGVGVDSQGQVYIISRAGGPSATTQVIRKLSGGRAWFGNQTKNVSSSPKIVVVSNTGNAPMTLTNKVITGTGAADFTIDPNTTSCRLGPGSVWNAGTTCLIGFIFKPSVTGARSATFTLLDDTVTNSNTVVLYGTGVLPTATMTILSPSAGQSFRSGTPVTFTVSVTSPSGAAPTGTLQFKVDGGNVGGPITLASGKASLTLSILKISAHTLSATYSGDANYAPGGPVSVSITVTAAMKASTTVVLTPRANPADSCKPVSFTTVVNSQVGGIPTGEVTLQTAGSIVARASLLNGMATVSVNGIHPGTYEFTSGYEGDARHLPSRSGVVHEIVIRGTSCVNGTPIGGPIRLPPQRVSETM